MRIAMAYIGVVLIWSTTPLGIQWSNSSLSFSAAVCLRMGGALLICVLLLAVMRKPLVHARRDWLTFCVVGLGIFVNMSLVYWSSQYISSGLIAVIFGMYPFSVGIWSSIFLRENAFTFPRVCALIIALLGLALVQFEKVAADSSVETIYGLISMVLATVLFGLSSVLQKKIGEDVDPFRQTTGSLLIAFPLFCLSWFLFDGALPHSLDDKSLFGVTYLAVLGSVVGGTLFFYVLKRCSVNSVSLITLITPLMALFIGMFLNNEEVTFIEFVGCMLIVFSLAIYIGALKVISKAVARGTGGVVRRLFKKIFKRRVVTP